MIRYLLGNWAIASICGGMLQVFNAFAQEHAPANAPAPPAPTVAAESGQQSEPTVAVRPPGGGMKKTGPKVAGRLSPITAQVLKLVDAGVSVPVIHAYIEQTPVAQPLSAADILALKEKGIADDLTLTLLKRGAAAPVAQAPRPQLRANSAPPPQADRRPGYAGMDPESYQFWWYHYAYPRALAQANERLFSSYGPSFVAPNDYGYYPPLAFPPQPPPARMDRR